MRKLSVLLAITIMTLLTTPAGAQVETVPLFAGQHTNVGSVTLSCDGSTLGATYTLGVGWCLVETHFYASNDEPRRGAPGQFPFAHEDLSAVTCATTDPYTIDLASAGIDPDFEIYTAAHAVVCENLGGTPDWQDYLGTIETSAGADGLVTIKVDQSSSTSYFQTTITDDDGELGGSYPGWCIDTDKTITPGTSYNAVPVPAYIIDSYGNVVINPEVIGLVNDPTRFDEVGWLINQGYVGNGYTYCDVQTAIWDLLGESRSACPGRENTRVANLVGFALANGMDFVPGCEQKVPVILVPVNSFGDYAAQITIAQITFAEIQVPCVVELGDCETAWALADNGQTWSRGGGWGEYFIYYGCQ